MKFSRSDEAQTVRFHVKPGSSVEGSTTLPMYATMKGALRGFVNLASSSHKEAEKRLGINSNVSGFNCGSTGCG